MLIFALRTDKPEAELYLCADNKVIAEEIWAAHRQLAETLHSKIAELLGREGKTELDIEGLVVYAGPGSFTGLRIGISVINAFAVSLGVQVASVSGEGWLHEGLKVLGASAKNHNLALPIYDMDAVTTQPRK